MPTEATGTNAKTIIVDSVFITGFTVTTYPSGSESMVINYATGFYDATGEFVFVEQKQLPIIGGAFNLIATSTPDTSSGLFAALQTILFDEIDKAATA